MSFRRIIKGSLISLTVLGMVGGSLNNNVANAKHRRHHYHYTRLIKRNKHYRRNHKLYRHHRKIRYRYHRKYNKKSAKLHAHKHNRIRNYSPKHHKHHKHHTLTDKQVRSQAHNQMIKDINQDREENGRSPVADSPIMDELANMRAKQDLNNFTHYDAANNNEPYELEDAKKLGIQFGKGAYTDSNGITHSYVFTENLASSDLDIEIEASPSGDPACYNHNGIEMANNTNTGLMYYDTSSNPSTNWGHRKNILYKPWKYVGVGVANKGKEYIIAEEFADWVRQGNDVEGNPDDNSASNNDSNSASNNTNNDTDTDNGSQSQSSYNYNSNNNNNGSSSSISESSDDGNNNININNNNNNTTSSNSDNDSYVNPLAGKTIHKNGITVTYTKDGMIARDTNGDTSSASGPNSTINIDGQTFTD